MSELQEYQNRYTRARLRREDGILEVTLGDPSGGPLLWDEPAHRELPDLFADIAADPENRVMILTGTGDEFCGRLGGGWDTAGGGFNKIYREGRLLLGNLLAIEVPVIAAVNGPARIHAELAVLSDIVLASETAVFQDGTHFAHGGVPGDGVHVVWPLLLGPNRGRYFLLTNAELSAEQALQAGVVGEVLPAEEVLPRAWEIARKMATYSDLGLRYTRIVLTERLRREMAADLGYGLVLEGLAGLDRPR